MSKKFLYVSLLVIFLLVVIIFFFILFQNSKENKLTEKYCRENPSGIECYSFSYRKLIPHFIVYDAFADDKPLKFLKAGKIEFSSYIVPYYALEKAEALIGYGTQTLLFEETYSNMYDKPSYAFDCGISSLRSNNNRCHFESECIGTDEYVLSYLTSSKRLHTYSQKIKDLNLENKPVFIRMDIAGAEPYVIDDILDHSKNITGMAIVIHADKPSQIRLLVDMLKKIEKDFVLVMRQTHYGDMRLNPVKIHLPGTRKIFGRATALSYVNKNLLDKYRIRLNQDSASFKWDGNAEYIYDSDILLYRYIPYFLKTKIEKYLISTENNTNE